MVKQKHHTARNQSIKNHKNGIKKPLRQRYRSMKGVGAVVFDLTNRLIPSSLETSVIRKSIIRRNKPYFYTIRRTISIFCLLNIRSFSGRRVESEWLRTVSVDFCLLWCLVVPFAYARLYYSHPSLFPALG